MNMRLLTVILFSFVLSSVAEAIDASVQYRPGEGNDDYRKYRPASPVLGQSSSPPQADDHSGSSTVPQAYINTDSRSKQNSIAQAIQDARGNLAIEKKWEHDPLSRPKLDLIPAVDIGKYRYTDRYLDLGDAEVSHYFILQEDYVFRNLNGRFDKIPAGFIWDGASIPKFWGAAGLEVGNTRYNSVIAEGLIHDYMYRNPQRYTKKEADELFYDNLSRCNNPNALKVYKGVDLFGDSSYLRHWNNQRQGYYDVFTPEFYAENLKTFQGGSKLSIVDFTALVPDKIWTEPIIGALVEGVIEESGRAIPGKEVDWRKQGVDWWGAKWMGKRFHMNIPYDEHGESPYHLFGFFINSGIACPYVYSAPISEFSLDDAFKLEGKVKKMIEDNTGIKLICEKNDFKQTYNHKYRFDSMYCRIFFDSNIEIRGMYVNDKKALAGKVWKEKSLISIKMSFEVGLSDCMYWHEYQKKFNGKCSIRDLLHGKIKTK